MALKPGTWIITSRKARSYGLPYDYEAVVIDSWDTDGDPEKWEDVECSILIESNGDWLGPYTIPLAGVGLTLKTPEPLITLPIPTSQIIVVSQPIIKEIDNELLEYYNKHPDALKFIKPKQLEDLAVAIYKNHGFEVERIGRWNQADGGVDILAIQKTFPMGELILAIQCKTSKNKISAEPIRSLSGVLDRFSAHKGVLMTSSEFTKNALIEAKNYFWRIELKDRNAIKDSLQSIFEIR